MFQSVLKAIVAYILQELNELLLEVHSHVSEDEPKA